VSHMHPDRAPEMSGSCRLDLRIPRAAGVEGYLLGGTYTAVVSHHLAEMATTAMLEPSWIVRAGRTGGEHSQRYDDYTVVDQLA